MQTRILALALISMVAYLAGCGGDVALLPANCAAAPVFTLLLPVERQEVTGDTVTVQIEVSNFEIVDRLGEEPAPCQGHFHVFLNDSLSILPETRFDLSLESVDPGPVQLVIQVHNNDHSLIEGIAPLRRTFIYTPSDGGGGNDEELLAFYPLAGNTVDESGNDNEATYFLEGYGADRNGLDGHAADLAGRTETVTIGASSAVAHPLIIGPHLDYNDDFTLSGWFLHTAPGSENVRLFGGGNWFSLYLIDSRISFGQLEEHRQRGPSVADPDHVDPNEWYHVAGVYEVEGNTGFMVLYVDGEEVDRLEIGAGGFGASPVCPFFIGPGLAPIGGEPVGVGGGPIDAGSECDAPYSLTPFSGRIDDVRVFDRALSATEIDSLFNE